MLVEPKDLAVGALVQARDSTGYWYNAKVIAKTGRGASHAALVRFIGFSKSHDAKFTAGAEALRERVNAAELRAEREAQYFQGRTEGRKADGTWEIERVLKVVRGQCLIRWKYWGPEWDSWEKGIDREIIAEFKEEQEITKAMSKAPSHVPILRGYGLKIGA